MTKLLDDDAIRSYRDTGFHTPLRGDRWSV